MALVSVCSSAAVPNQHNAHTAAKGAFRQSRVATKSRERCIRKGIRWFPHTITLNTSVAHASLTEGSRGIEGTEGSSIAPWEYSRNVDPDRYPSVINEADCLSSVCVDSSGKTNPDLMSLPIQQNILVLRREQRDCSFVYRLETQRFTLGCTCTRPVSFSLEHPISPSLDSKSNTRN
ncbi:interleukin-17A-like [Xenopus laevis]|nr:interleukin-17A-like [Xenopus laevis]